MTTPSLRGHTALVTGGSRGIGAAIVRALAEAGAAVAINFRERAGEANALANEIAKAGGRRSRSVPTFHRPTPSRRWFSARQSSSAVSFHGAGLASPTISAPLLSWFFRLC
jgi:NAD(P)-dependent dehydrogenase (short-subunit alcohol dehydrogenase family)